MGEVFAFPRAQPRGCTGKAAPLPQQATKTAMPPASTEDRIIRVAAELFACLDMPPTELRAALARASGKLFEMALTAGGEP